MAKFRKKPVVIEAVLFIGPQNAKEVEHWSGRKVKSGGGSQHGDLLYIETLEGTMRAEPGDWIIKGVSGEFYPCKPDIFEATYESA